MLSSATPYLLDLKRVMDFSQQRFIPPHNASIEVGVHGWWGCKDGEEWIIPPLYGGGFEPSEGLMLLELGGYRHFISTFEINSAEDCKGHIMRMGPSGAAQGFITVMGGNPTTTTWAGENYCEIIWIVG